MDIDRRIFREYDIRGVVGSQLDDAAVALIGKAIGTYFRKNDAGRIAVGYDARQSSPRFCEILVDELNGCGCDCVVVGMVPTPVLYHAVFTTDVDGGVMITGSHNPADHNGFKICLGVNALFGEQIREIAELIEHGVYATGSGTIAHADAITEYIRDLSTRVEPGPRKLKVVIDAGNGVGALTAEPLFRSLGVDVISIFGDPNAAFPNHHPDPTVEENLIDLIDEVLRTRSDVGIAFDGDADRIGVVDETGGIIWGDELMVVFARDVLEKMPGATIIGEVKCSQNLFADIERHGGHSIMSKAGHSIIKAKMRETGAVLAGEMSGHIFFADRYYGYDDAAYAGARLIEILSNTAKPLSQLLSDLPKTFSTPEIRVPCPDSTKFDVVERVAKHFARDHAVNTTDGARIDFDGGWGLVRASNTQAILVLRFEAKTTDALTSIRSEVEEFLATLL